MHYTKLTKFSSAPTSYSYNGFYLILSSRIYIIFRGSSIDNKLFVVDIALECNTIILCFVYSIHASTTYAIGKQQFSQQNPSVVGIEKYTLFYIVSRSVFGFYSINPHPKHEFQTHNIILSTVCIFAIKPSIKCNILSVFIIVLCLTGCIYLPHKINSVCTKVLLLYTILERNYCITK